MLNEDRIIALSNPNFKLTSSYKVQPIAPVSAAKKILFLGVLNIIANPPVAKNEKIILKSILLPPYCRSNTCA
jgi:hypothetical protein